jgi:hypothetical protein
MWKTGPMIDDYWLATVVGMTTACEGANLPGAIMRTDPP